MRDKRKVFSGRLQIYEKTVGKWREQMRSSGILLPVASLPSKYGIGSFSKEAYEFVDQLDRAGQKIWQILPLGPTGYGDSPVPVFFHVCRQPVFHQPRDTDRGGASDGSGSVMRLRMEPIPHI